MELVYLWVEKYKNIHHQEFNFSPRFRCEFKAEYEIDADGHEKLKDDCELVIEENVDEKGDKQYIGNFFGDNINVTAIVGKNGSGKSSLLSYITHIFKTVNKNVIIGIFKDNKIEIHVYNELLISKLINQTKYLDKIKKFKKDSKNNFPKSQTFLLSDLLYYTLSHLDSNASLNEQKSMHYLGVLDKTNKFDLHKYQNSLIENLLYLVISKNKHLINLISELDISLPVKIKAIEENRLNAYTDEMVMTGDFSYLSFSDVLDKLFDFHSNIGLESGEEWQKKKEYFLDQLRDISFENTHPITKEYLYVQIFVQDIFNLFEEDRIKQEAFALSEKKKEIESIIDDIYSGKDIISLLSEFYKNKHTHDFIEKLIKIFEYIDTHDHQSMYLPKIGKYISIDIKKITLDLWEWLIKNRYTKLFRFSFINEDNLPIIYSSGETILLDFIVKLLRLREEKNIKKSFYLLIDEIEIFLHPEWQKKYLNNIIKVIKEIFPEYTVNVILSTHSPFLLSDIPKQNIIFLDTDEEGNCKVVDGLKEKKETFGANIHMLLSDSFFMEDGLMGEFAKSKINEIIEFHDKVVEESKKQPPNYSLLKTEYEEAKTKFWQTQSIIGEEYLKQVIKNHLVDIESTLYGVSIAKKEEAQRLREEADRLDPQDG